MTSTEKLLTFGGLAALIVIVVDRFGGNLLTSAANAVNPLNTNNIFAQGSNMAASAITGTDTTLGGAIYSATHQYYLDTNGNIQQNNFLEPFWLVQILHPTWRVLANGNIVDPLWSPQIGSGLYSKWESAGYPMAQSFVVSTAGPTQAQIQNMLYAGTGLDLTGTGSSGTGTSTSTQASAGGGITL